MKEQGGTSRAQALGNRGRALGRAIAGRLSYANVAATIALFVALGGSAYAIGRGEVKTRNLGASAVTAPKIKNNAVGERKIHNNSVTTPKIRNGAVSAAKLAGGVRSRVEALETKVEALETLLAGVTREQVDGNETLRFSGMNVQVVDGTGTTYETPNALGNLIIGYSEQRAATATRTGSHYLIIGDLHEWTGTGGIVAGYFNTATAISASVIGGSENTASGTWASVTGGEGNTAGGINSSVTGGQFNAASGGWSSVSGGGSNAANGTASSILGGGASIVNGPIACHPTC